MSNLQEILPHGLAKRQNEAFKLEVLANVSDQIASLFPDAVCFTLDELSAFIEQSRSVLAEAGVPDNQQGIAMILGINLGSKPGNEGRVTSMLVATQFTEDDATGRVITINNAVVSSSSVIEQKLSDDEPVDFAFDSGGMYP